MIYYIEVQNGKYYLIQEVDKKTTELGEFSTIKEAQEALKKVENEK